VRKLRLNPFDRFLIISYWRHTERVSQHLPSLVGKYDLAIITSLTPKPTLMHQAMMPATKLHKILQTRLPTVSPVLDVVSVDEFNAGTSGEAASFVSGTECPVD
jgi:hypothetical protein